MEQFVRIADLDDVATLRLLESEARSQLNHFRGGERLGNEMPSVGDLWSARIDSDHWLVLVAGIDNVPLGYLCANMAMLSGVPLIEAVYVNQDVRELGLGDGLVTAAVEASRVAGAVAIDAYALPGDRETKNLFERSGLTARLIIVTKTIDQTQ